MSLTELEQQYLLGVFAPRYPVVFEAGEGARLLDENGREYIDFLAGIAVCSVGHARDEVADAASAQMHKLVHVSSYFYTEPQVRLAQRIAGLAGWGRSFFGNSGAEANECAIKLARLHGQNAGGPGKFEVVSADNSFHGRTLATLAATGQPAKQARFQPLPAGFLQVPYNDIAALEAAVSPERTAAVLLEVIQGEGGVVPATMEYLEAARRICDEAGALLILDEVQTGLCRTGSWLGFQQTPIEPDIYTLGKAIANGLPLSACVAREPVASTFEKGDHATTMMGGPVVCAAALEVLRIMEQDDLNSAAVEKGERLAEALFGLSGVTSVRGRGLLLAAELHGADATDVAARALDAGLVCNAVTTTAIRFAPPLVVTDDDIDEGVRIFGKVLAG
jgi:predicted acetylornithine/succinylornithine family transaminase